MIAKIKNHTVVYFLSVIAAAFSAGWGANVALQATKPPVIQENAPRKVPSDVCGQVAALSRSHSGRLAELTKLFKQEEAEAANFGHADQAHQWHVDAARAYSDQIKEENTSFEQQLVALQKIACVQ